ncbi:unnamed protein product [Heterobilharzia americana]|nr:unnamed protein product [Heterobilharzia americana]
MSTCLFAQHFWGEKHSGFDAMYQNFKLCYRTSAEFAEFLRESYSAEDNYYKALIKLSKQAGSYNTTSSFKPCWSLLKQLIDQISQVHLNIAQERQNLSRDVQKYLEEQHKRQKLIKDTEASTQEVVHAFQITSMQLQKAKEAYHSRYNEYERAMRLESGSSREQEKLEVKLKKAQDEYKYSVEKYNNLRNQFVSKMHISCAQFEEIEAAHLEQMREFLHRYASVWSVTGDALGKLHSQFGQDLAELTTDRLLNILVSERGTGTLEPQGVQFEDAEVAAAFSSNGTERTNGTTGSGVRVLEAFFGRETRAASALAIVGSGSKDNGGSGLNSLMDVRADVVSMASISVGVAPSVTNISISGNGTAKRREGFFRRRRNSLSQDSAAPNTTDNNPTGSSTSVGATTGIIPSIHTSGNSLSAFTVVAKRGIRRFGTPYSNGKDKQTKQINKSDPITSKNDDWRTVTPVELPKDEDGYSIRPSDPWGENANELNHSEADNDSVSEEESENEANKTFHGLKVNIRPVGELAPGVATKYDGDRSDTHLKLSEALKNSKYPVNSQAPPLLIDHRVGSTLRSPRSSTSLQHNIPITKVSGQDLINALPLPPLLPPPPPPLPLPPPPPPPQPPRSTSLSPKSELFPTGGGSMRIHDVSASSFSTVNRGNSTATLRPRGYSCNTWTKNTLFNVQDKKNKRTIEEDNVNSFQQKSSSNFQLEFNDSVSCSSLIDNSEKKDSSSILNNFNVWPVDDDTIRRCSSALPTSTNESIGQLNWMAFDLDTGEKSQFLSPPISWPSSFNTKINDNTIYKENRIIPEPPARLHNHLNITFSPSNYTINSLNNTINLAAAFTETWYARFFNGGGSSFSTASSTCQPPIQAINGTLTLAFSRINIEQKLMNKLTISPLLLKITNATRLRDLQPKLPGSSISLFTETTNSTIMFQSSLLDNRTNTTDTRSEIEKQNDNSDYLLTIPGDVLSCYLFPSIISYTENNSFIYNEDTLDKLNSSISSSNSPTYIKLDVLTYTVDVNAHVKGLYPALTPPIHLCTYWRCEALTTDFRLDYTAQWPTMNANKDSMKNIGDLCINLKVDGTVNRMQSLPIGTWLPESNHAIWRIPLYNPNFNNNNNFHHSNFTLKLDSSGTVRAKFTLTNGPSRPQPVNLQFFYEGSIASGVQLTLLSTDYYYMNLCKYRLISNRYICDPPININRYHQCNSVPQLKEEK